MHNRDIDLSIVIACYNEMQVIEKSIMRIEEIMRATRYTYEIILYDDGSTDGTREFARVLAKRSPHIIWKEHQTNMGYGKTISDGLRLARGRISGFIDMDLEVSAIYILPLVLEIEKGADIATASRKKGADIKSLPFHQKPYAMFYWLLRLIMGCSYIFLVRHLLKVNLHDTEVGCKFFNHQRILPILDEIEDSHWFWNTELSVRAYYAGLKLREIPALYLMNLRKKSTVKPISDSIYCLKKLFSFRKKILPQLKKMRS